MARESTDGTNGGCLCGKISYVLTANPLVTAICHCTHCQKQSGSAFSVNLVVRREDLKISGALSTFEDQADSGALIHRRFCGSCGSPIVTEPLDNLEITYLKAGTLDHGHGIVPTVEIWCASAQPWWTSDAPLQGFARNIPV
ncbi:GFA family protein [Novosphingobium silvae]|uniref:GFA family protein n=1 Tax=Novosphingobium silvae TaxID=2692619 RepID=UPI001926B600